MATVPLRISSTLYQQAKEAASTENRTIAGQVEHWAKVGRAALDNPELPISFIAESLTSLNEPRDGAAPFVPRTKL